MYETTQISLSKNALAFFRLLLFLYPKQYKKQFGQEMFILLTEMYQEEISKKRKISIGFWIGQLCDITKSAIEQHIYLIDEIGMKKYLQQTLHVNKYNVFGGIFLFPAFLMLMIDFISRVLQGDLVHYNRPVYNFLSHTPLYWTPILFTWVILFPLLAAVINLIPLVKNATHGKVSIQPFLFIRRNFVSLTLFCLGLFFVLMIRLHDFAPCMVHGLLRFGIGQYWQIVSVCKGA